ncbi:hypothetical protein B0H15DRAFT_810431 [Mycena belliarum]|uniref:F-box domain-containing protein n=1 Tax=Mycena belliarum TaxID=1033014 RepID=A0AAD6UJS4_9AGAR|nr:hypothetical protein B0H15DRAFT_810431 [Mycena belliae]
MSTVRRQSGRIANQVLSSGKAEENSTLNLKTKGSAAVQVKPKSLSDKRCQPDEEEGSEELQEEREARSDSTEYANPTPGKRLVKRQKLEKATSTTPKKRKGIVNKTCYLTTIPLDVLLEIFVRLEPKDLVLLARTSHAFRGQLLSQSSNNIWRKARENVDGPDCPQDLSEQQWTHLLYGPAQCQSCGAKNVQRVDFGLRRRSCTMCLKRNLVVKSSFKKHFPDLEQTVLDYIPYTNIGGSAHGHASRSKFYWKSDIEKMIQTLAVYNRDVHMRVVDASKKLEDFTAERIALVASVVDHAAICQDWSRHLAIRRAEQERGRASRRYNAIKARFMERGYVEPDVSCIKHEDSVRQTSQLTDRIWNRIYPALELRIQTERDERLQAERDGRIAARIRLAETICTEYKKTLAPVQWRFFPGTHAILQLPAFDSVVKAPDDVNVEPTHFKEARDALPGFVGSWAALREAELLRLLDDGQRLALSRSGTQAGPSSTPDTRSLGLATSVFECAQQLCNAKRVSPNALIGWAGAASHHCYAATTGFYASTRRIKHVETILAYSERGSAAAASLVSMVGLSGQHATCEDMDKLDLRFLCLTCPGRTGQNNKQTYSAYSWRAAISHFVDAQHSAPLWRQLNTVETQKVKAAEGADPTLSWSCSHCAQFFDDCHTFTKVVDHVKTVHALANPTAPEDLFRHLDLTRAPAIFLVASLQLEYHCKRCSGNARNRHFDMNGVQQHLKQKHKILNPLSNEDWEATTQ